MPKRISPASTTQGQAATDINPVTLAKARQGIFALNSIKGHTANNQKAGGNRAFSTDYTAACDAALFDKSLRDHITFADHSLATDSVFSRTQLVRAQRIFRKRPVRP